LRRADEPDRWLSGAWHVPSRGTALPRRHCDARGLGRRPARARSRRAPVPRNP
jgi:hypothetical protein